MKINAKRDGYTLELTHTEAGELAANLFQFKDIAPTSPLISELRLGLKDAPFGYLQTRFVLDDQPPF